MYSKPLTFYCKSRILIALGDSIALANSIARASSIARNKKQPNKGTASSALNWLANLKTSKNTSIFQSCKFDRLPERPLLRLAANNVWAIE
ncbi:MAG: hypothetical protein HC849_00515 [Oscillatoriales cyanobacterium RU_3_3]|nr:hypothetical protein [Microcoleus sp. SU_5_3]NJL65833.1 hypothetical protein [Microcoleus sp. SM1_3_4]NJM59015.1 hypothetical protein [Oscillatoriales cyanobacterium RU_3_3]